MIVMINQMQIRNFKNISNFHFDFRNKDVIIFDGPNGFGKTSFFDAVEFVISGKINRITNLRGKGGFKSVILLKEQVKELNIKIEFIINNESVVICRKNKVNNRLSSNMKKPDNWDIYHTYVLNDFEDENYSEDKEINQDKLNLLLGDFKYDELFNLFFYVQQEETSFYLKMTEKNRMDTLALLFNTESKNNEKEKITNSKVKIKKILQKYKDGLAKEKSILSNIKLSDSGDEKQEYLSISPEEKLIGKWDSEDFSIDSLETLNKYNSILDELILLKENEKNYVNSNNNIRITDLLSSDDRLKNIILFQLYSNDHKKIFADQNRLENFKLLDKSLDKINRYTGGSIPLKEMKKNKIMADDFFENVNSLINSQKDLLKNNSELERIKTNLISSRNNLKSKFEQLHIQSPGQLDEKCPFCGENYGSYEDVIKHFEDYSKTVENILTINGEQLNSINMNLTGEMKKYIDNLKLLIQELEDEKEIMKYFNVIKQNYREIENDIKLLNELSFNYTKYQIDSKTNLDYLNSSIIAIKDELSDEIKDVEIDYNYFENNETTFKTLLNNDFTVLSKLITEHLKLKKEYFKTNFMQNASKLYKETNKRIDELSSKVNKYEDLYEKTISIENVYRLNIAEHENNVAKAIEIPFHIYSAKIIKNHHYGSGYFLEKDVSDSTSKLKFTSRLPIDHDAVNYLSSGQLSALVISFSLALNKSYKTTFRTLLIDDPAQTLDELNLYSFIDLLSREFSNKQFFFSTHESDKAQFLEYKFDFYGFKTKRVNMKYKHLGN